MYVHDVTHDGVITFVGEVGSGLGNGGYGSYQDGFFHSGFSSQYAKFDISNLTQIGTGSSGLGGRDEDFGQVLGNLVFVGDDHGVGSALIVHQTAPDTNGPEVHWVHPQDGATDIEMTARVGVSMSDSVDIGSVDSNTFTVRRLGGVALPGKYSVQMGLVNFTPDSPLESDTTYEVVVSGIKDLVGNPGGTFVSQFTTADTSPPGCTLDPSPKAEVNASVYFDVGTVSGKEPITYSWDFGDDSSPTATSSDPATSHLYSTPGRYGVVLTVQNEFGSGGCSTVQIVHNPLTALPPVSSNTIIHNGERSYNVNPDNDTVTAISESDLSKVWEVSVGDNPRTLAEAPNGDIWIVNQGDATISVIGASDGILLDTIALPYASRPYGIAFSPNGSAAYVTLQGLDRLLKLDILGNIVGGINVGVQPRGIAISGDSSRILITRFISPPDHAEVRDVDAVTFTVAGTFDLAFDLGPDTESSGRGVPNYISSVTIAPDGRRAFVPSKKDNVARGLFRDGQQLTFESVVRTIVSQIDLTNGTEDLAARIDFNDRNMAVVVAFSPVGDIFLVAMQGSNKVEVYDTSNRSFLGAMNTGLAPQGMVFNDDASKLYVNNYMSRSVSVFDTSDLIEAVGNSAAQLAEVIAVANEKMLPEVLFGKQIFYNASDPRMSRDGYISCASCHADGGGDGQVWDFTQDGEGLRNTISLVGRAGMTHGNVHWTANFDEIQDFENDIRGRFGGAGFLTDPDFDSNMWNPNVPPVVHADEMESSRRTALAQDAAHTVSIQNFGFERSMLKAGEVLAWTNVDGVPHTITSGSRGQASGEFDSGPIAPGQSFAVRFDRPGEYSFTCTLHPFMTATVVVTE